MLYTNRKLESIYKKTLNERVDKRAIKQEFAESHLKLQISHYKVALIFSLAFLIPTLFANLFGLILLVNIFENYRFYILLILGFIFFASIYFIFKAIKSFRSGTKEKRKELEKIQTYGYYSEDNGQPLIKGYLVDAYGNHIFARDSFPFSYLSLSKKSISVYKDEFQIKEKTNSVDLLKNNHPQPIAKAIINNNLFEEIEKVKVGFGNRLIRFNQIYKPYDNPYYELIEYGKIIGTIKRTEVREIILKIPEDIEIPIQLFFTWWAIKFWKIYDAERARRFY